MTEQAAESKKGGCWKYVLIGLAVMLVLSIIGGYLAYEGAVGFLSTMSEKYTDTTPDELPIVDATREEVDYVFERVAAFAEALMEDRAPSPLELSARDINILIQRHPEYADITEGAVHVTIEEDEVHGQISLPLGDYADMFAGRWLNGSAIFRIDISAGRLQVFMESAIVRGEPLSEEIMSILRSDNLAKNVNRDEETAAIIEKLDSIIVQGGVLTVYPAQGPREK